MIELCTECRRAFNFNEAAPEKSKTSNEPLKARNDVIIDYEPSPASKRMKIEDIKMSSTLDNVTGGGDTGEPSGGATGGGDTGEPSGGDTGEPSGGDTGEPGGGATGEPSGTCVETDVCGEPTSTHHQAANAMTKEKPLETALDINSDHVEPNNTVSSLSSQVVCSACLGLLSDSFIDTLVCAITDEITAANYKHLKTFSLSISTPLTLIIRQCGVMFYLRENFEITEELVPREAYVKESLRHKLYSKLRIKLAPLENDIESPFKIILKLDHSHSSMEYRQASKIWPDAFPTPKKKRKKGPWKEKRKEDSKNDEQTIFNTTNIHRALEDATPQDFEKVDFLSATQLCTYSIEFHHASLFVGGRYCKYSRNLSQTPWFIAGVRKAATSVQELICGHIQTLSCASEVRFSSSGREDCDVRMLGNGRPFLVELLNPKNIELNLKEIELLQSQINSSSDLVEVKQLEVMTKAAAISLKEGEMEKRKEYRALVWTPEVVTQEDVDKLSEMKETIVHQKTPIRVLHRRTLATRDKTIHTMRGELIDSHHFYLHLNTQAGTYIKEFIHGDFGRTQPNLRSIMGQEVDILTLDVCNVLLDWPPPHQHK